MLRDDDIAGFTSDEGELHRDDYFFLTYWFETAEEPRRVAASLCSEMSTTQWRRADAEEDFRALHAAKLVHLELLEAVDRPSSPSSFAEGYRFHRCLARIAYPLVNVGESIPNLLTACAGEGAFFSPGITAIKLIDIEFPQGFLASFAGPKFGIEGLRGLLEVYDRPLFFGVVKPNIGLSPQAFAEIAAEAWLGGIDIAKDDELLFDTPHSPLRERCRMLADRKREGEDETGEKKIYLANITDEVSRLKGLHDVAVDHGARAVMVNVMTVGLSAVRQLAEHASVPVVAHFDMIAPFSRLPFFGISTAVITKLQRLAGCDAIIMPGFGARMLTEEEEVHDNVDVSVVPLGGLKRSLPVPGGSDWAGTLPLTYEKLRTVDFGFCPGRGVFGHPQGPRSGARSLRQAWEAIQQRLPLELYAEEHPELREAILHFGGGRVPAVESKKKALIPTPLDDFVSMLRNRGG